VQKYQEEEKNDLKIAAAPTTRANHRKDDGNRKLKLPAVSSVYQCSALLILSGIFVQSTRNVNSEMGKMKQNRELLSLVD
jgi:hypothetical protein